MAGWSSEGGRLVAIREAKDCSPEELAIDFCNSGLMVIDGRHALELLDAVGNDNAKGEYYLTDIVEIANARGLKAIAVETAWRARSASTAGPNWRRRNRSGSSAGAGN
jgi:bifunctional UDP-N-acetylglucosamine pyrophosphorylase / glucosamine-1-phosphate N-acetyltransferase